MGYQVKCLLGHESSMRKFRYTVCVSYLYEIWRMFGRRGSKLCVKKKSLKAEKYVNKIKEAKKIIKNWTFTHLTIDRHFFPCHFVFRFRFKQGEMIFFFFLNKSNWWFLLPFLSSVVTQLTESTVPYVIRLHGLLVKFVHCLLLTHWY